MAHHVGTYAQKINVVEERQPDVVIPIKNYRICAPSATTLRDMSNEKYTNNQNKLRSRYHSRKKS